MTISPDRARDLVARFRGRRILVVGDLMLDRYVYGEVSRISPEAPVPVVRVTHDHSVPGGASNVAANVTALGGQALVCGILGHDAAGRELRDLLVDGGVDLNAVVRDDAYGTTVKTRVVAERQQVVRVDRDPEGQPGPDTIDALCRAVEEAIPRVDGVIIEDYGRGVLQQRVVDAVLRAARAAGVPSGYDPKDNHPLAVDGVTLATPNRREAIVASGRDERHGLTAAEEEAEMHQVGRDLYARWKPEALLITLGPEGMVLVHQGEPDHHVPTRATEVFDVSGAGDTVIATSMMAVAAGASFVEAAELANYAAGVVVGKLGTAACSREELAAALGLD
jgi:D-beta-D-heptose 7-phosphate kinase/D-beta-D-heptose 1-phosphate adenosyltransferase